VEHIGNLREHVENVLKCGAIGNILWNTLQTLGTGFKCISIKHGGTT